MRDEIQERKKYGEWLLHTQKTVERPFPVILDDWMEHGRISSDPLVRDDVLADIIAILRARPEKKSQIEGC